MKVRPLTTDILKQIILEEKAKIVQADQFADSLEKKQDHEAAGQVGKEAGSLPDGKTDEVDADEFADTLEKAIDYYTALKIRETKLQEALNKVQETKSILKERIRKLK